MKLTQHFSTVQPGKRRALAAFTMVEIAICLAVIGFALVAIIGVLPIGMTVQKENREQTIINFDANYLMNALRNGAQSMDNLTNYVFSITIASTVCDSNGVPKTTPAPTVTVFTTSNYSIGTTTNAGTVFLTNGSNILGLMSTPKYIQDTVDKPGDFYSNNVSVDMRAITGAAVDQATNQSSREFAFAYRLTIDTISSGQFPISVVGGGGVPQNLSIPFDANTNGPATAWTNLNQFVQDNLHEFRLGFRWPILPNGKSGQASLVSRTSAGGRLNPQPALFSGELTPPYLMISQAYTPTP